MYGPISGLSPVPHRLVYCSFVVDFEIGKCESSDFVPFFFKIFLAILGPLLFYMNFRISLSISEGGGIALNLQIRLGVVTIL